MTDTKLLSEIEKWKEMYDFNLQIWNNERVNCYITKGDIELKVFGQCATLRECLTKCIEWCYEQNPSGKVVKEGPGTRCVQCGCKIAKGNDLCGECACEDDCDYL